MQSASIRVTVRSGAGIVGVGGGMVAVGCSAVGAGIVGVGGAVVAVGCSAVGSAFDVTVRVGTGIVGVGGAMVAVGCSAVGSAFDTGASVVFCAQLAKETARMTTKGRTIA